jgi:hypothetical protein
MIYPRLVELPLLEVARTWFSAVEGYSTALIRKKQNLLGHPEGRAMRKLQFHEHHNDRLKPKELLIVRLL